MTLSQAIESYGKAVSDIPAAAYARDEAAAYVEVHIEQGPVLEAENLPLGVVTAIVGQSRMRVVVLGEAGHAGTVPMQMRHDALAGSAEIVLAIERIAKDYAADSMVATVGRIEASPGASNVIAGRVGFSLDLRSATDALRKAAIEQIRGQAQRIASARKLEVTFEPFHETVTTPCAPHLQELLAGAIGDVGQRAIRLPSGAGHDAQIMARLCPAAMLFVRCREGSATIRRNMRARRISGSRPRRWCALSKSSPKRRNTNFRIRSPYRAGRIRPRARSSRSRSRRL